MQAIPIGAHVSVNIASIGGRNQTAYGEVLEHHYNRNRTSMKLIVRTDNGFGTIIVDPADATEVTS